MIRFDFVTNNLPLKILSLTFALILWFIVAVKTPAEQEFAVPLLFNNIPSGLRIAGAFPEKVNIRLVGSQMILHQFERQNKRLTLDMKKLEEGPVSFTEIAKYLEIPSGLSLTRISPSRIEVQLIKDLENQP
ncbi:MAG: CdaR family protein [Deltaproteobacteria bacterium]|jgi:YbbR domain-containing protein